MLRAVHSQKTLKSLHKTTEVLNFFQIFGGRKCTAGTAEIQTGDFWFWCTSHRLL